MNALGLLICVGCLGLILYVVGGELIRDVLEDFFASDDRAARIRDAEVRDELEASWKLPPRDPRKRLV